MENSSESSMAVDVAIDDESKLTVSLQIASSLTSWRHRRHRVISVQFFQNPGNLPLHAADQPESSTFRNDDGELDFSLPLRQEKQSISIPYTAMPSFTYGDLINLRVSLEDTVTGEVLSYESVDFLVKKNGLPDFFSHQRMRDYLKTEQQTEVRLAKIDYWLSRNADKDQVVRMGIELLKELAMNGSSEAAEKLADVYSDNRFTIHNKNEAEKWKHHLAKKMPKKPDTHVQSEKNKKLPAQISDEASLKTCEELAESGDNEAQFMIYAYSCLPEGSSYEDSRAFAYVKAAAESGLTKAVRALAGAYKKNLVFISIENAQEYIGILKTAAKKKQALAEYLLFHISYEGSCLGQPVNGNRKEAYAWLLSSAEHGGIDAAYDLWHYFEQGNEFLMEQEKALKWLIFAADHGLAKAKTRLGDLYIDGHYLDKDDRKGLAYLKEASEQKDWEAQMKQYEGYYEGRYKDILWEKNRTKALKLLKSFAQSGNPRACVLIMDKYERDNEMMMDHREAVGYLRSAAKSGDALAMYRYANVLLDGFYVSADLAEAKHLIETSAALNYPEAQFALYHYYFSGYKSLHHDHVNKERAYQWLLKAARTLPSAQYELWKLSKQDNAADWIITDKRAVEYLFRSAAQKYSPALFQVGMAFGSGSGIETNPERGLSLIEEAAALHHPEAVYELAQIRLRGSFGGQEVAKDENEGLHLLLLSAELGYPLACKQVGEWYAKGLLPNESELWVRQIVKAAIDAGLALDEQVSPLVKQEAASAN
ncbi:sel1 repeat family protein [Sporolactobacillus shoreicorticis]|uniref:Sel1 repeat family protein n=1 Tax=Sporolactobacillus shoreicorticis TaxID=1923877 RepID=A0ABW5S2S8_9BACL|nr:tetratricopeptide repeat protein [Sporolactobacillus shoreicorticis]MCO7125850.1 sel1 repeat family protein [Sporolactobacillus shoreicorticis]